MSKITAEPLARTACVYVRQSTSDQVHNNLESQRRQYGLVDRARSLGWQKATVIDDDLGRSGSGVHRPGFEVPDSDTDTLTGLPVSSSFESTGSSNLNFPSICDLLLIRGWEEFSSYRWGLLDFR